MLRFNWCEWLLTAAILFLAVGWGVDHWKLSRHVELLRDGMNEAQWRADKLVSWMDSQRDIDAQVTDNAINITKTDGTTFSYSRQ